MNLFHTIRRSVPILILRIVLLVILVEVAVFGLVFILEWLIGAANIDVQYLAPIIQIAALPLELIAVLTVVLQWASVQYEIRDNEVIVKSGVISRQERSYPYNNMQSVVVHQSFFGRLFRAGTISVYIPTLGQELTFNEVEDPHTFAETIKRALPYPGSGQILVRK